MEEQTILVTGSTDGIGKVTAHALARQGHRRPRQVSTGEGVRRLEELEEATVQTGWPSSSPADLVQERVRGLAEEVGETHDSLDVLINNAGSLCQNEKLHPAGSR